MEEKLYFKPGNYGKGIKKKTAKPDNNKDAGAKSHSLRNLIIFVLVLTIIIMVILWLLRGKTTTSGRFPENIKNESLECNISGLIYEKTNRITSPKTETKITMIFYGVDDLNSINLRHTIHLSSSEEAARSEAIAHVQLAENLADSGLDYGEFNNKFTRIDNNLTLELYDNGSFKKDIMYGFFLVDKISDSDHYPTKLEEFRNNYENKGFACKSSIDK
ncbi:hypothetical protein IJH19_02485 [Candidatus Saccharibacteria bacterium]|nr:hypothetical protein [Candidatus Saccharibacteria bacterium]